MNSGGTMHGQVDTEQVICAHTTKEINYSLAVFQRDGAGSVEYCVGQADEIVRQQRRTIGHGRDRG